MHFLDHRSLDETQKYIDHLVAHTERENADIMATFERRRTKEASGAPTPPANAQATTLHSAVIAFTAKNT